MMQRKLTLLAIPLAAALLGACSDEDPSGVPGGTEGPGETGGETDDPGSLGDPNFEQKSTILDERVVDYSAALRTASLKLVRALPTLAQIKNVATAADPKAAYEGEIDDMLADKRFNARMIKYWKDVMRIGGDDTLDTAPVLAALLMKEGRPYTELFTADAGNCPTYDAATDTFTETDCASGAPEQAGVLTNPSVMKHFYSNMSFRRVRWLQEVFVCTKFPAETGEARKVDDKDFLSPWEFESIGNSPVNFRDTSSVVCANCHTTMNHIAPLLGHFDLEGMWQTGISVFTPAVPDPVPTELSHWLKSGEKTAWRYGLEAEDLAKLGAAIAGDDDIADCAVARMWNFVMSKEDIVNDLATVPYEVLDPYRAEFNENGQDLKATLRKMLVSGDFVSF